MHQQAYGTSEGGGVDRCPSSGTVCLPDLCATCQPLSLPPMLLQMTVEAVKVKLSFHCGTSPSSMLVQLLDESGNLTATLHEDHRKLGFYSPHNG